MARFRDLRDRYWRRDAWPVWVPFLLTVAVNLRRIVEFLGDAEFVLENGDRLAAIGDNLTWVDDVLFHPMSGLALLLVSIVGFVVVGRRPIPLPQAEADDEELAEAATLDDWAPVSFAGVQWRYQGRYYNEVPWIKPYCPDHFVLLMLKIEGFNVVSYEEPSKNIRVTTVDSDDLPTSLWCSEGHVVPLESDDDSLGHSWLQAERLMEAAIRKDQYG